MSYSQTWLEDPAAIRVILVIAKVYDVVAAQEIDMCLSNSGYTTTNGVTFYPVLVGNISLTEKFASESSISMTWGDLEITNKNGEYDKYLDSSKYIWTNRSIQIYYGDPGWAYTFNQIPTNFLKVFDGLIADCDSRNIQSFNIKLRDKLEKLNAPVSEAILGTYGDWGAQQNKEQLKPIIFGEVFNTTPILINPATLQYMFSCSNPEKLSSILTNNVALNGSAELLIEIRDNGAPVYIYSDVANYGGAEVNNSNSTFTLKSPPAGEITISAQGVKRSVNLETGAILEGTYNNTIANLIATIVRSFGKQSTRLSVDDVDWINFKTFDTSVPASAGVFLDATTNVLEVCQKLAASVGANIFMSRIGKLQLLRFGEAYGTPVAITPNDMIFNTFQITDRLVPSSVKGIYWGRNWTIQNNLTTAIPAEHKAEFARAWLDAKAKDNSVAALYNSETEIASKETFLIDGTYAYQEAERLLDYYKVKRTSYSFTARSRLMSLNLGQAITLQHSRFGLDVAVPGQVIGLTPDWTKGQIEVEVIV